MLYFTPEFVVVETPAGFYVRDQTDFSWVFGVDLEDLLKETKALQAHFRAMAREFAAQKREDDRQEYLSYVTALQDVLDVEGADLPDIITVG